MHKHIYPILNKLGIRSWCPEIEDSAMEQVENLARLPFAFKHIALMPDCHTGYGMPIGGVFAANNVVVPSAVGFDISCGMLSYKTPLVALDTPKEVLRGVIQTARKTIPIGGKWRGEAQRDDMPEIKSGDSLKIVEEQWERATCQIGTLGGKNSNHFIEIQKDSNQNIWVMIHSGSRNLGYKVAEHYGNLAKKLNKKYYSSIPEKYQLAFLPMDSDEGQAYWREMNYCTEFALANRMRMLEDVKKAFQGNREIPQVIWHDEVLNIHHNYATMEHHFGQNVVVHRKGATSARKGQLGIIPGSQGTNSYIVKGLGNELSFNSCSHGAGRKMGRKQAIRELNFEDEKKALDEKNILHSVTSKSTLDEAPGAYKNIDEVMKNQEDLVEIVETLTPLAVIKG